MDKLIYHGTHQTGGMCMIAVFEHRLDDEISLGITIGEDSMMVWSTYKAANDWINWEGEFADGEGDIDKHIICDREYSQINDDCCTIKYGCYTFCERSGQTVVLRDGDIILDVPRMHPCGHFPDDLPWDLDAGRYIDHAQLTATRIRWMIKEGEVDGVNLNEMIDTCIDDDTLMVLTQPSDLDLNYFCSDWSGVLRRACATLNAEHSGYLVPDAEAVWRSLLDMIYFAANTQAFSRRYKRKQEEAS